MDLAPLGEVPSLGPVLVSTRKDAHGEQAGALPRHDRQVIGLDLLDERPYLAAVIPDSVQRPIGMKLSYHVCEPFASGNTGEIPEKSPADGQDTVVQGFGLPLTVPSTAYNPNRHAILDIKVCELVCEFSLLSPLQNG